MKYKNVKITRKSPHRCAGLTGINGLTENQQSMQKSCLATLYSSLIIFNQNFTFVTALSKSQTTYSYIFLLYFPPHYPLLILTLTEDWLDSERWAWFAIALNQTSSLNLVHPSKFLPENCLVTISLPIILLNCKCKAWTNIPVSSDQSQTNYSYSIENMYFLQSEINATSIKKHLLTGARN